MQKETICAALQTKVLGHTLYFHPFTASTNDEAKRMAATAPNGTVIIAAHQTAGRGRKGRSFYSPNGCGIYMSVIIKRDLPLNRTGLLTSAVAVAVARAIETLTPATVHIKWVNDLLICGKKVCGILCESTPDAIIIGIGVNVSTLQFPPEIEKIASSLLKESGTAPDRAVLIAAILSELEMLLDRFEDGAFLEESRRRSAVLGKTVTVLRGNETFSALAVAIDEGGGLVVKTETDTLTLSSGEVSLRL